MRFDDYRCQLRAVQAPAGWEEAVRARIAAPASAAPPESSALPVSAPRRPFRLRLAAAALVAAVALALGGASAVAGLAGPGPAASLVAPPAEALDLATPALRLDPDAGLSFQLADGCARVRLRAEFRCRNAGEGAYEVAVHGDGLALQSRGAAFDDPTSSTLAFEPGRPAGGYVVVEVPLNRDAWRQRLIGRGFDDEAALEVLREALRLLGEGRVVLSRPGAPDAVYAPDLPAALRGSANEPPLSDALDAGSRRLVIPLRRLS